jgi:hypothetical protein
LKKIVAESRLPVLTLDVSDGSVPLAVERKADWFESSGGLCLL